MSSKIKPRMLLVTQYSERPPGYEFSPFGPRFAEQFKRLGWDVTMFAYRQLYWQDRVLRLSRYRIRSVADKRMHSALTQLCVEVQPQVIFLEKAELISPAWVAELRTRAERPLIVFYNPDDPVIFEQLGRKLGPLADVVLTSSELCVPMYGDLGVKNTHFFTFWAEPVTQRLSAEEIGPEYTCDVAFAGYYHPERALLLQHLYTRLAAKGISLKVWGKGWEQAPEPVRNSVWTGKAITSDRDLQRMLQGCKIALNIHFVWTKYGGMKSNLRSYEALANGAFLLSDRTVGMADLFAVGEEMVCYEDAEDAAAKIMHYLGHPEDRRQIAQCGYAALCNRYTLERWIERINAHITSAMEQGQAS